MGDTFKVTAPIILQDYWRSSSAYRVRIALNLLGLAYHSNPVDLANGAQSEPENLAQNPQGLVPTLMIDGLCLTQSLAIIEYLHETRHAGFLPSDPPGRARVRAFAMAIAMEVQPVCNLRVVRHAVAASGGEIKTQDWMGHFISLGLIGFEAMLATGPTGAFCHGDQPTLADLCLVPQIYNARRWEVDLTAYPRTIAIAERLEALPAVAAAHPDRVRPS
ncbi:Gst Glutathione S-transferase [Paracoccaceae bacterium]|jgi:maleylacetoacetate isomerase